MSFQISYSKEGLTFLKLSEVSFRDVAKTKFCKSISKIFRKTCISYPMMRTLMCAYQGVRNVSFSETFILVLNK